MGSCGSWDSPAPLSVLRSQKLQKISKTSPDTSPDISEANHGTMSKKTFLRASAAIVLGIPAAVLTAGVFYHEKRKPVLPPATLRKDLAHATIVMTGATSGIGQATALQLATSGASFILGSRDAQRSEETTSTLLEAGATSVKTFELDISNMKSVQTFCDQVLAHTPNGIDVVVSAAAEIHTEPEGQRTKEGIDLSFATNHLGLHVLLQQLEPVLLQQRHGNKQEQRRPRVVLVGSRLETKGSTLLSIPSLKTSHGQILVGDSVSYGQRLIKENNASANEEHSDATTLLSLPPILSPMDRYAVTKFSNMLLAQSLSDRWRRRGRGSAVSPKVLVVTPGMVNTGLWRHFPLWYRTLTWPLRTVALRTAEEAASGVVWAVASVEAEAMTVDNSYVYLSDGVSIEPSTPARNSELAGELFDACDVLMESTR